jgi:hypothetical protein
MHEWHFSIGKKGVSEISVAVVRGGGGPAVEAVKTKWKLAKAKRWWPTRQSNVIFRSMLYHHPRFLHPHLPLACKSQNSSCSKKKNNQCPFDSTSVPAWGAALKSCKHAPGVCDLYLGHACTHPPASWTLTIISSIQCSVANWTLDGKAKASTTPCIVSKAKDGVRVSDCMPSRTKKQTRASWHLRACWVGACCMHYMNSIVFQRVG